MQVTTEAISGLERRLTITVPAEQIKSQFEARLKKVAKSAKINGFRPGKVPMSRIRADYGPGIQQEVIDQSIRDSVFQAIRAKNINAVGIPNIESVELNDQGLHYQAVVEVYPEVSLASFDGLSIERKTSDINDADVDSMIESLRKQRQTFKDTKGMAKNTFQVTFDFAGTVDGEAFEGGTAEDFKLVLGSGQMIPGFEDGILSMKAGEEKTIDVTFPENYQAEQLAGKAAQFKINLKTVEKPVLPEIDDGFLALFGITEGGEEQLKVEVRKNMQREVKHSLRTQTKQAAFDAVLAANGEIQVPKAMVAEQIQRQRQAMLQQFAQQFGGAQKFDDNMLPDQLFQAEAERSVKLGVLVAKIIEQNKLTVDQERVIGMISEMSESYEDPAEVIDYYSNDKQQRAQIEAVVLEDQVVDHILAAASVSEVAMSYQELLAAQQAANQRG